MILNSSQAIISKFVAMNFPMAISGLIVTHGRNESKHNECGLQKPSRSNRETKVLYLQATDLC